MEARRISLTAAQTTDTATRSFALWSGGAHCIAKNVLRMPLSANTEMEKDTPHRGEGVRG
jgi:hypothetical protein